MPKSSRPVRFLLGLLFGLLLCAPSVQASAQAPWAEGGPSRAQDLKITLVTFSPGPQVPSWFGHTAIGVEDQRLGQKVLYNYGMFSFDNKMLMKFVMGRLEFWVAPTPYDPTLRMYAAQDRDVRILELNLPPDKRLKMARYLEWNVRPQNRVYLYHHYQDNCATRIRDLIDDATDGAFKHQAARPARMGLREHTRRHSQWAILDFGMMFGESHDVDKPIQVWDEMFLPEELEAGVKRLTYTDAQGNTVPLAGRETLYHTTSTLEPTPQQPRTLWPWLLLWGTLIGLFGLALGIRYFRAPERRGRRIILGLYHSLVGMCFGIAGAMLLFMWGVTDHTLAHHNENLLLANPLLLLFVMPLGLAVAKGSRRALALLPKVWGVMAICGLVALLLKILPWQSQQNWMTLALCLPMLAGMTASAWWVERAQKEAAGQGG